MENVITIINSCVLFPHFADWRQPPKHKRLWETEIAEGLSGVETRAGMRAVPRRQMTFLVTADQGERTRLEARMDAAAIAGFAAAPLHGRYTVLGTAAPAGSQMLFAQTGSAWNWQPGDYAILMRDDLCFDIAPVTGVGLNVAGDWTADAEIPVNAFILNFAPGLNHAWPAGTLIWPVLFGQYNPEKELALTGEHGAGNITIAELTSARSIQIGQLNQGPGIGQQVVGSTTKVA